MSDSAKAVDFSAAPRLLPSAATGAGQAVAEGQYRGEKVVALGDQDSLLDNLDVLEDREDIEIAKREISESKESDLLARLMKLTKIEEMLDNLRDLRQKDLERVLSQLLRWNGADPRQLEEQVSQSFREPAHRFAALTALVAALRDQGEAAKPRLDVAERALQQLVEEQGPVIRAGLNVSVSAERFAGETLSDIQSLRDTYRDAVLDYPGISETYGALAEKHGTASLPQTIDFLLSALGADLAAQGSSIDKPKLVAIRDDMYRLQTLAGLLEKCQALMDKFPAMNPGRLVPPRGIGGSETLGSLLLKGVIDLQQAKWVCPEQITALPGSLGIAGLEGEVRFLQEFKELARSIPLKTYIDEEQRPRLLGAIQQALDGAIEREEAGE